RGQWRVPSPVGLCLDGPRCRAWTLQRPLLALRGARRQAVGRPRQGCVSAPQGGPHLKRRLFEVPPGESGPLVPWLAVRLGVPFKEAELLLRRGAVYLGGRRTQDSAARVKGGDKLLVVLEESGRSVLAPEPPPVPLRVVFQDEALLAVDKPAGLVAQATPGGARSLAALASAHLGH